MANAHEKGRGARGTFGGALLIIAGRASTSRIPILMSDPTETPPVRAPAFPENLDWLHTGGRRLSLADLRGKVVFLDFWTYG